ncbi:hypothetical protein Y032_0277g1110 [Ancylostoma ceylanicum]|uniref:Uncharacterized protein n=1 Tax=Ancylostoma ceylanicum TaxID=53326 RepID=A0A016S864_9BILA|nr:hypothetical protein Y032_0277g1110 [Ancylostoma ceylanicum]
MVATQAGVEDAPYGMENQKKSFQENLAETSGGRSFVFQNKLAASDDLGNGQAVLETVTEQDPVIPTVATHAFAS